MRKIKLLIGVMIWTATALCPAAKTVAEAKRQTVLDLLNKYVVKSAETAYPQMPPQPSGNTVPCRVRVVDIKGRPVVDAEVIAVERTSHFAAGHVTESILDIKRTNSAGLATLALAYIEKSTVRVTLAARKKGLACGWDYLKTRSGPLEQPITILLDESHTLGGTVADELGKPIAGARVGGHFFSEHTNSGIEPGTQFDWFTATTDAWGRFQFDNLPPDTVADFHVTAAGYAPIYTFMAKDTFACRGYAVGQTDAGIVMQRPSAIRGRVIDRAGNPVPSVQLLARHDKKSGNYYCRGRTVSDSRGNFLIEALPADTYSVQLVAPENRIAQWVALDAKAVTKPGRTTENVTVRADKGGILDLSVVDTATDTPAGNAWVIISKKA